MDNLQQTLENIFGLKDFRAWQREIIENILSKKDSLVFMPTWGWKSLTYQLPWVVFEWLTIVISPLISLMKDQVDFLNSLWIKARLINSTISYWEINEIFFDLENNKTNPIKFLYIAPERLNSSKFLEIIKKINISLLAIDEAHCISQWGHDFRPSYMKILPFLKELRERKFFPVVALTATATPKVRQDIITRLGIEDAKIFIKWFDRKNIVIMVREISEKIKKFEKVLEILEHIKWTWIIYCSSRKSVDEVYDMLLEYKIKAGKYTWAMLASVREEMQNKFMNWEYKVIVATNAFWMWIDKKDIRFVIHFNLPWSIENYYQEIWRAWRDWKQSVAICLASYWDTKIQEFFIENTYPTKEEVLKLYDYLYKDIKLWEGKGKVLQMTINHISSHSSLSNDMKVSSWLKILEKYNIISRWIDENLKEEWFRWRWITLIQEKRIHSHLLINWKKQEELKKEAYYKLEQIKKLLFYPSCRRKFILKYFWDTKDLEKIWDNCGTCDFCLDKNKFDKLEKKDLIPVSSFALILETVKEYDEQYWQVMIRRVLEGSEEKKLLQNNLDLFKYYWALKDYSRNAIWAMIDALIFEWYLYKTSWAYPVLWITELGSAVIIRNTALKEALEELNSYVIWKVGFDNLFKKENKKQNKKSKIDTKKETLKLLKEWKNIEEIASLRELTKITIESHIVDLYIYWDLNLIDILKLVSLSSIKEVKKVIKNNFSWEVERLREIKEILDKNWKNNISYFDIKIAIAMMQKGDI